jgi:hypothetical protein
MNFPDRALAFITLAAVLLGCWLRLASPLEIEYKGDEAFMFGRSQHVGVDEPWPALGMASGAGGVRNPGLSIWIFAGLAKLTGATTPVGLARAVQVLNCLALGALGLFALRFAGAERRAWLWALNLAALSPTGILLQRKIWAQSVLPLLCVLLLMAWWRRRTFWGATLWAALALIAAEIHMTGFFFFVAVTLWTLLFWRDSMNWRGWAAGFVVGGLSALPWLQATLPHLLRPGTEGPRLLHVFGPEFWCLWVSEGFGLGLAHNLGGDLPALLGQPLFGGRATWLVGLAELGLVVILVFFLWRAVAAFWCAQPTWRARFAALAATRSESSFLCGAALVAYGLLLSMPDLTLYRHYLLIVFPLPYFWLSAVALAPDSRRPGLGEKLLFVALAFNLLVAVQLFPFLRENGGAPAGDFGVSWRAQAARVVAP